MIFMIYRDRARRLVAFSVGVCFKTLIFGGAVKSTVAVCLLCSSSPLFPRGLMRTRLQRPWNSWVSEAVNIKTSFSQPSWARCVSELLFLRVVDVPAGFLALGEWQPYCRALETFLRQVSAHGVLSRNQAVEVFLTSSDVGFLPVSASVNKLEFNGSSFREKGLQ